MITLLLSINAYTIKKPNCIVDEDTFQYVKYNKITTFFF